jgi:hypothetical protein
MMNSVPHATELSVVMLGQRNDTIIHRENDLRAYKAVTSTQPWSTIFVRAGVLDLSSYDTMTESQQVPMDTAPIAAEPHGAPASTAPSQDAPAEAIMKTETPTKASTADPPGQGAAHMETEMVATFLDQHPGKESEAVLSMIERSRASYTSMAESNKRLESQLREFVESNKALQEQVTTRAESDKSRLMSFIKSLPPSADPDVVRREEELAKKFKSFGTGDERQLITAGVMHDTLQMAYRAGQTRSDGSRKRKLVDRITELTSMAPNPAATSSPSMQAPAEKSAAFTRITAAFGF